jgi:hypothetical protein
MILEVYRGMGRENWDYFKTSMFIATGNYVVFHTVLSNVDLL